MVKNKNKMVIRFKSYRGHQMRLKLLAEDYMYRRCGQRKSRKMIDSYIGLANYIEYHSTVQEKKGIKISLVNIPTKFLRDTFGRHYSEIIDDMKTNGIIRVNDKYSSGSFSKSYSINGEMLYEESKGEDKIYVTTRVIGKDLDAYLRLIKVCVKKVVYDGVVYGLDLIKMKEEVEDGRLGVNQAVRGMRCFMDRSNNHGHKYNGGRDYNWFAVMESDFRRFIVGENGGKMMEALDLPAGNVMCISLLAWKNGVIKMEELKKVVEYLKKDIYTVVMDYAVQDNPTLYAVSSRSEFKWATQVFLNSTAERFVGASGKVSKFFRLNLPGLYRYIRDYPRNSKGKKTMFCDFIEVEKILIEHIQTIMMSRWGVHTIRVHDAVYADSTMLPPGFDGDKFVFSIVEDQKWLDHFLTL